MNKNFIIVLSVACFLVVAVSVAAQAPVEYKGKLDPQLKAVTWTFGSLRVKEAPLDARSSFKVPLADSDRVFLSEVHASSEGVYPIAFVRHSQGDPTLFVDLDRSNTWTENERVKFAPGTDGEIQASFTVSLPAGLAFKSYPKTVILIPGRAGAGDALPQIYESSGHFVEGHVTINGRDTLVLYGGVSLTSGAVSPRDGMLGVDTNGDGRIDDNPMGWEVANARNEDVVFRVADKQVPIASADVKTGAVVFRMGDKYVSTASVDAKTGTIVMRDHPASDYLRIELAVGKPVPDFTYLDFDGNGHRLSELRGKHVLLDFWGSWCGPCIAEFPNLKEAYTRFRPRGFEILGMDEEQAETGKLGPDMQSALQVVKEKGVTWPQARADSVRDVIRKRFRIVGYPTAILLDDQGRIVSWGGAGQWSLRGAGLLETLDAVLPPAK